MDSTPKFPEAIDATARRSFAACPTKFWYGSVRRVVREGASIHLHAGKAFARGVEVARWAYYAQERDLKGSLCDGAKALIEEWGDEDPMDDHQKGLNGLLTALFHYWTAIWPPHEDPIQPYMRPTGEPAVEYTFNLPIPETSHPETGEPIHLQGRFDMLGEFAGMPIIVDEKTTGQLGSHFMNGWELRSQVTAYIWAAQQFGHKVEMAEIRGISPQKHDVKFANVQTWREPWQVQQWLDQVRDDIEHMKFYWQRGRWPMNLDDSCTAYGGCPFMKLCTSKDPEEWLDIEFESNTWDPLA